jgi:hypothetical protein
MAALDIDIPPKALRGYAVYDLSDFVHSRKWKAMELHRHLEMFPGRTRFALVARPEVCDCYRDIIARRLIQDERRQLHFDLDLAQTHGLDTGPVEALLSRMGGQDPLGDLLLLDQAQDSAINLVYACSAIREARSQIIAASAAVCACDGAICRLASHGKVDQARDFGLRVVPLAREFTHLRLELRQGRGADILKHAETVVGRALSLLAEVRAAR